MAGALIVVLLFAVALLAPYISPYDPGAINIKIVLQEPSPEHLFGTDALGRDVLSRMIWGSRISLLVGFVAMGIASLIGVFLGALAGYYGRWVDNLIMRFVDIMLCFPTFFLILAVVAFLEPSIWNIMIIIGVTGWMGAAPAGPGGISQLERTGFYHGGKSPARRISGLFFLKSCPMPWRRSWFPPPWGWPGRFSPNLL
jgi:peptide/nickel transport system permease protein